MEHVDQVTVVGPAIAVLVLYHFSAEQRHLTAVTFLVDWIEMVLRAKVIHLTNNRSIDLSKCVEVVIHFRCGLILLYKDIAIRLFIGVGECIWVSSTRSFLREEVATLERRRLDAGDLFINHLRRCLGVGSRHSVGCLLDMLHEAFHDVDDVMLLDRFLVDTSHIELE